MVDLQEKERKLHKRFQKLTKHQKVMFTDRGNSAIFIAMSIAKQNNPRPHILIPDQGGWYSFRRYPQFFNFNIQEVKTNYGVIDLKDLKKKVNNGSCLILTSLAGYFAEQPLRKIANACKKAGCLVIEDASGAVGDRKLCNGKHSDIIVASFGRWKPIEVGYGGFISVKKKEYFDNVKEAISMVKVHPDLYKNLNPLLRKNKLKKLMQLQEKVKKELKKRKQEVLHYDKRGVNVVAKFSPEVLEYCQEKGFQHILCPHYIRVNEKAISIELKRLSHEQIENHLKRKS